MKKCIIRWLNSWPVMKIWLTFHSLGVIATTICCRAAFSAGSLSCRLSFSLSSGSVDKYSTSCKVQHWKQKKQKQNLFAMKKKKVETGHPVYCYCQMYSFSLLLFHTLVSGFPSFLSIFRSYRKLTLNITLGKAIGDVWEKLRCHKIMRYTNSFVFAWFVFQL